MEKSASLIDPLTEPKMEAVIVACRRHISPLFDDCHWAPLPAGMPLMRRQEDGDSR